MFVHKMHVLFRENLMIMLKIKIPLGTEDLAHSVRYKCRSGAKNGLYQYGLFVCVSVIRSVHTE